VSGHALTDRVAEHLPRAGLQQLCAVIEELKRRAKNGHLAPREVWIALELDPLTGTVQAIVVPRRYGWD
jgi:hypothetical protein